MTRGKLITFEGDDAVGKSTQATRLETTLRAHGINVLKTREPGGTPLGEKLRDLLLHDSEGLDGTAETLLLLAARRVHLQKKIIPALDNGVWVICDRFIDSTFAYQSGGRGVDMEFISDLTGKVSEGVIPDLTFYLHTPPSKTRNALLGDDTFEREDGDFHRRVSDTFRRLAEEQARIVQIDNHSSHGDAGQWRDRDDIGVEIWRTVTEKLLKNC